MYKFKKHKGKNLLIIKKYKYGREFILITKIHHVFHVKIK